MKLQRGQLVNRPWLWFLVIAVARVAVGAGAFFLGLWPFKRPLWRLQGIAHCRHDCPNATRVHVVPAGIASCACGDASRSSGLAPILLNSSLWALALVVIVRRFDRRSAYVPSGIK